MDNGPAREAGTAQKLQEAGEVSGDPFEVSTIRREVGDCVMVGRASLLYENNSL